MCGFSVWGDRRTSAAGPYKASSAARAAARSAATRALSMRRWRRFSWSVLCAMSAKYLRAFCGGGRRGWGGGGGWCVWRCGGGRCGDECPGAPTRTVTSSWCASYRQKGSDFSPNKPTVTTFGTAARRAASGFTAGLPCLPAAAGARPGPVTASRPCVRWSVFAVRLDLGLPLIAVGLALFQRF